MNTRIFSYYKGRSFEYKVKYFLENLGYFVIRSARSAFPDLVAVKQGKPLLIECRLNSYLSLKEKRKLIDLALTVGARSALAYNDNGEVKLKLLEYVGTNG